MSRYSADEFVCCLQPDIKTVTKWLAVEVIQEAVSGVRTEIIGGSQTHRAGRGRTNTFSPNRFQREKTHAK